MKLISSIFIIFLGFFSISTFAQTSWRGKVLLTSAEGTIDSTTVGSDVKNADNLSLFTEPSEFGFDFNMYINEGTVVDGKKIKKKKREQQKRRRLKRQQNDSIYIQNHLSIKEFKDTLEYKFHSWVSYDLGHSGWGHISINTASFNFNDGKHYISKVEILQKNNNYPFENTTVLAQYDPNTKKLIPTSNNKVKLIQYYSFPNSIGNNDYSCSATLLVYFKKVSESKN